MDKLNTAQHARIIMQVEAKARIAKSAWEASSDSRYGVGYATKQGDRAGRHADDIQELLKPYGILVDWPGLYPRFQVNGREYMEVADAVEAAVRGMTE